MIGLFYLGEGQTRYKNTPFFMERLKQSAWQLPPVLLIQLSQRKPGCLELASILPLLNLIVGWPLKVQTQHFLKYDDPISHVFCKLLALKPMVTMYVSHAHLAETEPRTHLMCFGWSSAVVLSIYPSMTLHFLAPYTVWIPEKITS